jgi:hypothetical protein
LSSVSPSPKVVIGCSFVKSLEVTSLLWRPEILESFWWDIPFFHYFIREPLFFLYEGESQIQKFSLE